MIQVGRDDIKQVMDALAIKSWGILNLEDAHHEEAIISVALPYQLEGRKSPKDTRLCRVDAFAWSFDYHEVVKSILKEVVNRLERHIKKTFESAQIYVDQSPYNDQEIGFRTGLGQMGKNHLLINDVYGTHFFIGYVVLSAKILDVPVKSQALYHPACLNCERCTRACPSQICTFEQTDMRQCISALTQTKAELSEVERRLIGRNLYGCSICQMVCPQNHNAVFQPSIYPITTDNWVDAFEILDMNKRTFKEKYGHMGFAWRSLWVYKRNALIALANSGDSSHLEALQKYADLREDEKLKTTYLWAVETLSKKI